MQSHILVIFVPPLINSTLCINKNYVMIMRNDKHLDKGHLKQELFVHTCISLTNQRLFRNTFEQFQST